MTSITNNIEISFWNLITNSSIIEIPIIQRDFAQGRVNEKTNKIRVLFLNSLVKTIESENNLLELDFVYGNVENDVFQPLDGQQRLTTLFLLHWYIALKTGFLLNTKKHFLKFTYETRISSREFCNELVDKGDFLGEGETISEKISDSIWFFLSWKKDPTIKAMLVMLNSIEERLNVKSDEELKKFWQKLTSENPPITFHFKQLNDIGLTDDLYIKMNARGKELTDFENFKARFEKHIKNNKWETDSLNPTDTFFHNVDTAWTDLFWKHRGFDNLIDNEFIKFVTGVAINSYAQYLDIIKDSEDEQNTRTALEKKSKGKITEDAVKKERIERRITTLFNNPTDVSPNDFPTKNTFEYLKKCFDIYSKNQNDKLFPRHLPLWDFVKNEKDIIKNNQDIGNNLFIEFIKNSASETTYKQRVLFYAQTQYLLSTQTMDSELFSEWMRVVRNIVQNATIDSASAFIGAIGLINEISKGSQNIYKYLAQNNIQSGFASNQTLEEVLKSSIIEKNSNNKQVIFATEDINFFKGRITFALYCVDFENTDNNFDSNLLNSIYKVVCEHLSSYDISNKFRSALLTVRKNDYYDYWGTWSYGTDSHKRCLIESTFDLKGNFTHGIYKDYLKDLLLMLVNKPLDRIIDEYICPQEMPNWKCRLIKEPQLLDNHCQSHFFGISNDNNYCYLFYYKKRPSCIEECFKIE